MDLMQEIHEHFEFLKRAKEKGMINFRKYNDGEIVQVYGVNNLFNLSNGNEITILDRGVDEEMYQFEANFSRDEITFLCVLDELEKEELEALINGHQQNDG